MNKRFYAVMRVLLRPVYGLLWPSKITGRENIPAEGQFVMCANHISARDPLFLAVKLPKRFYTFLAKKELFENKFLNLVIGDKGLGAIPVDRGNADLNAIRTSLKVLKDGEALGIFPQGTRSKDNTPTPMLSGCAMIALRAGAPIIPVYIDGPYRLFHRVDIRIGGPVEVEDLGRKFDNVTLDKATKRIEAAVWSMKDTK